MNVYIEMLTVDVTERLGICHDFLLIFQWALY